MSREQLELWPDEAPGERLNWSISRDKRLKYCPRQYYLYHYASRGGWAGDPRSLARQTWVLRSLRTRYMWVGEVVHEMLELAMGSFRRGEAVSVDALVERGTRRMRAQYAESVQGLYWERATACGLMEHEYREDIAREEWQAQRNRMERCLRAFFALPLAETLRTIPPWRWLAVESLGSFDLDGATVLVKPDCAFRDARGHVYLIDWKTGRARPEEERLQLAVYGLYAKRNWAVGEEGLTAWAVHLDDENGLASLDEHRLQLTDLAAAEGQVRVSVAGMRELAGKGEPDMQRFPMVTERERCTYCVFRRVCQR